MKNGSYPDEFLQFVKTIYGLQISMQLDDIIPTSMDHLYLLFIYAAKEATKNERERIAEMLDDEDWTYGAALVRAGK